MQKYRRGQVSSLALAFLLETSSLLNNKFVVAHVFGHTDFFKHNIWFAPTNRQMVESERSADSPSTAWTREAWKYLFPPAGASTSLATGRPLKGEPKPSRPKKVPVAPEKDLLRSAGTAPERPAGRIGSKPDPNVTLALWKFTVFPC